MFIPMIPKDLRIEIKGINTIHCPTEYEFQVYYKELTLKYSSRGVNTNQLMTRLSTSGVLTDFQPNNNQGEE